MVGRHHTAHSVAVPLVFDEHTAPAGLGAESRQLLLMVLREGFLTAALGAGTGLAVAAFLTRLMSAVLFGVTPLDPASFLLAPVVLFPVVVIACLRPAVIAARTDPARVLRM
jgi:ABC-type antimicrobial peptide transport system permease subunit